MNILPMVLAFITLFCLGVNLIFQDVVSMRAKKESYVSLVKVQRDFQTRVEHKQFVNAKRKARQTAQKQHQNPPKKDKMPSNAKYENPRKRFHVHIAGKLNITPLFESVDAPIKQPLYETAANLIRILYEKTAIYTLGFEYELLDFIVEQGQKNSSTEAFEDFYQYVPRAKPRIYKALKGTPSYVLETNEGYPPISHYFLIARGQKRKPVIFYYASAPLIKALFHEDLSRKIEEKEKLKWEEKKKHNPLKKTELEQLVASNFKDKNQMAKLELLIDFNRKTQVQSELLIKDRATGISLIKQY